MLIVGQDYASHTVYRAFFNFLQKVEYIKPLCTCYVASKVNRFYPTCFIYSPDTFYVVFSYIILLHNVFFSQISQYLFLICPQFIITPSKLIIVPEYTLIPYFQFSSVISKVSFLQLVYSNQHLNKGW